MLEPRPGRKPILIANKTVDQIKQQVGKSGMHFSAPVLSYVPPPAPKRRPTMPHIDPPPLSLTPASTDTNTNTNVSKVKKPARSLNEYAHSLPTYGPNNYLDFGSPEDLNLLDDGGKELYRVGKRVSQLSTITEKRQSLSPSLGSSPTIISLLHTERLSAPKGRSSSLSSVSSKAQSREDSKSSGQGEFDLFELEQSLPSIAPDDGLKFEMETGSEVHADGGESGDYLPNFT